MLSSRSDSAPALRWIRVLWASSPLVTIGGIRPLADTDEDTEQVSTTPGRDHGDMSTDLHGRDRQPSPEEGPDKPERPKSSLSIAQVVGGALAAMTAAALGSRLSVAGTVVGAAFASIIAAVAGSIYTSSLRRTSKHVSTVLSKVRPTTPGAPAASTDAAAAPAASGETATDATWVLPTQPAASAPQSGAGTPAAASGSRIGWKSVLLGAVAMFVVAAVVLTGIELVTGRALSGGSGTTVGQVADPETRPSPTPTRRATPSPSATPRASATATPTTSAEPSVTASSAPSNEPTAEPTATPSETPTPSATATPEPSTAPSAAGGSPGATPTP